MPNTYVFIQYYIFLLAHMPFSTFIVIYFYWYMPSKALLTILLSTICWLLIIEGWPKRVDHRRLCWLCSRVATAELRSTPLPVPHPWVQYRNCAVSIKHVSKITQHFCRVAVHPPVGSSVYSLTSQSFSTFFLSRKFSTIYHKVHLSKALWCLSRLF